MKKSIIFLVMGIVVFLSSCGEKQQQVQNTQLNPDVVEAEKVKQNLETVGADAFEKAVKSGEYTILDLRTNGELEQSGIIGESVVQIDVYEDPQYMEKLQILDPDEKYAIYCRSGGRSGRVLSQMKELGFVNVVELQGGINNWKKSGKSLVEYKN